MNIFNFVKRKGKIEIVSNTNLKKGTFITDIIGFFCYRKIKDYESKNINGFDEIFLFKCHDKNYDRFLKNFIHVNFGSIIAGSNKNKIGNCSIIKYLNSDLEVRVGIITIKDIKYGESFVLEI